MGVEVKRLCIKKIEDMKRFLLKKKVDGPQTVVSVEYLESGVYVVKVGERVEKFVKQ